MLDEPTGVPTTLEADGIENELMMSDSASAEPTELVMTQRIRPTTSKEL